MTEWTIPVLDNIVLTQVHRSKLIQSKHPYFVEPEYDPNYVEIFRAKRYTELLETAVKDIKKFNSEEARFWYIEALLITYYHKEAFEKTMEYLNEVNDEFWKLRILQQRGTSYLKLGKYSLSNKIFNEIKGILEERNYSHELADLYNSIGYICDVKGKLDDALAYYELSEKLRDEAKGDYFKEIEMRGFTLQNKGVVYRKKKDFDSAITFFAKAYMIFREDENIEGQILTIYEIMRIELAKNNIGSAKMWHRKMIDIDRKHDNQLFHHIRLVSSGILLMKSPRLADKVEAIDIFELCINSEDLFVEYRLVSLISLVQLRLQEYQLANSKEVMEEIWELLDQCMKLAVENKLAPEMIEIDLVKANINRVTGDFEKSLNHIIEAEAFVEENGITHLREKVQSAKDDLNNHIQVTRDAIRKSKKFVEKREEAKLIDYLQSVRDII